MTNEANISKDLDEKILRVITFCAEEVNRIYLENGSFNPFTIAFDEENLFVDEHYAEDLESINAKAFQAVYLVSHLADGYVYCYDGSVNTDHGDKDALIFETGKSNFESGLGYALLYTIDEDKKLNYSEWLLDLGEVNNFLSNPRSKEEADNTNEQS